MTWSHVWKTGKKKDTDTLYKYVCMSVHTCLHMMSEHVKGVEGSNDVEDVGAPWMEAWMLLWAGRQPGHAQEGKLGHMRSSFVVQLLSHVQLFVTLWTAACQASLSFTIYWSLVKLMSVELVMPSNHLILCCPLLLLPLAFPSIKVFSNWVSSSHQVAQVLEL